MREKLETKIVFWIIDFILEGEMRPMPLNGKFDFGMLLILESVINYRTYSIVSSFPTMKFSILRSDFLFEVVQRYTGVDIIVMDLIFSAGLFMTGYLRD